MLHPFFCPLLSIIKLCLLHKAVFALILPLFMSDPLLLCLIGFSFNSSVKLVAAKLLIQELV